MDKSKIGQASDIKIAAIGLGDVDPVDSAVICRGIATRPLSPVQGLAATQSDGNLKLSWTRRARGTWLWSDYVDVPLKEETEAYQVGFGSTNAPFALWEVNTSDLLLSSATLSSLVGNHGHAFLWVRQVGTYQLSYALQLIEL